MCSVEHFLENISLKLTTVPNTEGQDLSAKVSHAVIRAALGSSAAEAREAGSFTGGGLWQEVQWLCRSLWEGHRP